jgi:hypothetical protein
MIKVTHRIGRLVELRMIAPLAMDDFTTLQRDMGAITSKAPARLVVCADLSAAVLFPEPLADRLARYFRADNQRLERVALVVGDGATLFLQVERLLREGGGAQSSPGSRLEPSSSRGTRGGDTHVDAWGSAAPDSGPRPSSPMVKRAPTRRAFRSPSEAMSWLDELLTPDERARLRTFLDPRRASD